MNKVEEFINSGVLEVYVMGSVTAEESAEVESMVALYPEIRTELKQIAETLEQYATLNAVDPDVTIKPLLLGIIDYENRLKNGEKAFSPPMLNPTSRLDDFADVLKREDMVAPEDFKDFFVKIFGYNENAMTALVWIRKRSPLEVHNHEHENFFIVEGSCDIVVDGEVNSLVPGNYFSIPLHKSHEVIVTSEIPCKVILQRQAA